MVNGFGGFEFDVICQAQPLITALQTYANSSIPRSKYTAYCLRGAYADIFAILVDGGSSNKYLIFLQVLISFVTKTDLTLAFGGQRSDPAELRVH